MITIFYYPPYDKSVYLGGYEMMIKNFFSLSFVTEQHNSRSYLAVTGIVLFTSVLTISNAQARDMYSNKPVEVVVYEGVPIDYSNRDDVIFIDDTSSQNGFSNMIVAQDYIDNYSSQPKTVANHTRPSSQPQSLSNTRPTQPKDIPLAVKSMDLIAQNKPSQPNKALIENAKGKDPELVAFYANVLRMQKSNPSKQSTPSTTLTGKQTSTKYLVQKKPKSNDVQLSLTTSKGKNPELVAFYMDVFVNQKNNPSKQSTPSTILAVKQISTKNVVHKKSKFNDVQLSLTTSKGKDPELVAFYKQVFGNDMSSSSKYIPVVVTSKTKDPELVAFYEREFGKNTSRTKVPVLTKNGSSKLNISLSSKLDQKRSVKKLKG